MTRPPKAAPPRVDVAVGSPVPGSYRGGEVLGEWTVEAWNCARPDQVTRPPELAHLSTFRFPPANASVRKLDRRNDEKHVGVPGCPSAGQGVSPEKVVGAPLGPSSVPEQDEDVRVGDKKSGRNGSFLPPPGTDVPVKASGSYLGCGRPAEPLPRPRVTAAGESVATVPGPGR